MMGGDSKKTWIGGCAWKEDGGFDERAFGKEDIEFILHKGKRFGEKVWERV